MVAKHKIGSSGMFHPASHCCKPLPIAKWFSPVVCLLLLFGWSRSEDDDQRITCSSSTFSAQETPHTIVLIKIGGSSITHKANKETLNEDALNWFASTLARQVSPLYRKPDDGEEEEEEEKKSSVSSSSFRSHSRKTAFVVVHGAGSFGHHTAKEYGMKGRVEPPPRLLASEDDHRNETTRRRDMQGLAETRLSVQKLDQMVVSSFVQHGMNAVALSPCFAVPGMQAHGGDEDVRASLQSLIQTTLQAGLVPVLHGDACLYGPSAGGILSGDVLMEMIGVAPWVSEAVFLTDVDGVFTKDPRSDPNAKLLRSIAVDDKGDVLTEELEASASAHSHDVTGGLKVSRY